MVLKENGNLPSGQEMRLVVAPIGIGLWCFAFLAQDVKDGEAENWNAEEVLAAIKVGTEETNEQRRQRGFAPLVVKGWEEKPVTIHAINNGYQLQHAAPRTCRLLEHEHGWLIGRSSCVETAGRDASREFGL